ncbi:alpha/beta fold hydrolase [Kineococcus sp. LSe6-4]|uniref:Alpha/beta fold hydrolase n=1 Tax=Kineococcus halophytocola TaxID=3234027 RepID=A0ABV4H3Z9_9ACTN
MPPGARDRVLVPVDPLGADGAVQVAADVTGTGPTVLLLAGQSLGPETATGTAADLAGAFRVVVVHTRGTGGSTGGPGPGGWTTATFAADAVAVLDALGVARAHVHGFSMGGRVAQVLAARFPDRVDRLVLGASGPGGAHEVRCEADVARTLRHAASPAGRQGLADLFFTPGWSARHPGTAARFAPTGSPSVRRAHHGASTGHDGWDLLPRIAARTLVVHGGDDRLTPPANGRLLAGRVPGAELVVLDGARHGYPAQFRARTAELLRAFLG